MTQIRLQSLTLSNFKGLKSLTLDLAGGNTSLYGANATGKTTVYDAFLWILFDKDSQNKSAFNIKTLDANGEPLHGLDHEVEAVLTVDGQALTLKKSYKEKWTKRRGSATAEFTGHTTDYYIDGVPAKKGEYDAKVDELVKEDVFKLLTSPTYFNEQLHWQERREILLDVCGDISDGDVIAADKALSRLPAILQGRSLDDHLKIMASQRKLINKELQELPTRIDEVMRGLPDVSDIDIADVEQKRKALDDAIAVATQELVQRKAGGGISAKVQELNAIESEILGLKSEAYRQVEAQLNTLRQTQDGIRAKVSDCKSEIATDEQNIIDGELRLAKLGTDIAELRVQWHKINGQQWDGSPHCPTCNQLLPSDQIDMAIAAFNRQRAEALERISTAGRDATEQRGQLAETIRTAKERLAQGKERLAKAMAWQAETAQTIEALQVQPHDDPATRAKEQVREDLLAAIKTITADNSGAIAEAETYLRGLQAEKEQLQADAWRHSQRQAGQERIGKLKAEERELASEYEELEAQLYLCEQFIRTKVGLLEDKINSRFEMARFKLFEQQINGALNEVCDTTYNGVPYSDMNNAARINTGLDIIRTLSKHYRFSAPIFIDNSEAVVQLLPIDSQVIRLVVSGADEQLRTERDDE